MAEYTALLMEFAQPRWKIATILVSDACDDSILFWGQLSDSEVSDLDSWSFPKTLERRGCPGYW